MKWFFILLVSVFIGKLCYCQTGHFESFFQSDLNSIKIEKSATWSTSIKTEIDTIIQFDKISKNVSLEMSKCMKRHILDTTFSISNLKSDNEYLHSNFSDRNPIMDEIGKIDSLGSRNLEWLLDSAEFLTDANSNIIKIDSLIRNSVIGDHQSSLSLKITNNQNDTLFIESLETWSPFYLPLKVQFKNQEFFTTNLNFCNCFLELNLKDLKSSSWHTNFLWELYLIRNLKKN